MRCTAISGYNGMKSDTNTFPFETSFQITRLLLERNTAWSPTYILRLRLHVTLQLFPVYVYLPFRTLFLLHLFRVFLPCTFFLTFFPVFLSRPFSCSAHTCILSTVGLNSFHICDRIFFSHIPGRKMCNEITGREIYKH